jgi:nitrogenase iron protein NifH
VLEYEPDSAQAAQYRSLAARIMENTRFTIPTPLEIDDLESLALEYL